MMLVLEHATVEVRDPYGHYGQGMVAEETLELRNVGTGIDAFTVVAIDPNGRKSVQVPPTTLEDAREAFGLMAASRVPDFLR